MKPVLPHSVLISGSSSCALERRIHSVLNQASLSLSKTALDFEMPSSEKSLTNSSELKISRSRPSASLPAEPGDQPSSARKLRKASGMMPMSLYEVTDVAPWRLERRVLSGPRMSGTCAKMGSGAPSAWYCSTCFGVLEM